MTSTARKISIENSPARRAWPGSIREFRVQRAFGYYSGMAVHVDGRQSIPVNNRRSSAVSLMAITSKTMQIPILLGRAFREPTVKLPPVAIVNETMAKRFGRMRIRLESVSTRTRTPVTEIVAPKDGKYPPCSKGRCLFMYPANRFWTVQDVADSILCA
jgi:hypothetical protein